MVDFICPECIGEKTLSNRMVKMRPKFDDANKCDIHPTKKGIPVAEVARIVDDVVRSNFGWGQYMVVPRMEDDRIDHIQEGENIDDLLGGILVADGGVVIAIKNWLLENDQYNPQDGEEGFYHDDQNYAAVHHDGYVFSRLWERFRKSIQHDQRFFNDDARDFLNNIFEELHRLSGEDRRKVVYFAGPGETLSRIYRVRRADTLEAQDKIKLAPWTELAAPPKKLRVPGRMNPSGIVGLYCALEMDTCVAEMRPPVGSQLVGTALDIIRPICVLDLTQFEGPPKTVSMFNPRHSRMSDQWAFMQKFRHEISRPILPSDEHLEYIPTQVVSEYLTHQLDVYLKGKLCNIDAILYSSAQLPGGTNIVLFGDAALVEQPVEEEISNGQADEFTDDWISYFSSSEPLPDPALRILEEHTHVLCVESAKFQTELVHQDALDYDF